MHICFKCLLTQVFVCYVCHCLRFADYRVINSCCDSMEEVPGTNLKELESKKTWCLNHCEWYWLSCVGKKTKPSQFHFAVPKTSNLFHFTMFTVKECSVHKVQHHRTCHWRQTHLGQVRLSVWTSLSFYLFSLPLMCLVALSLHSAKRSSVSLLCSSIFCSLWDSCLCVRQWSVCVSLCVFERVTHSGQ